MIGRPSKKQIDQIDGHGMVSRQRRMVIGELHDELFKDWLDKNNLPIPKRDNMVYRFTIIGPNRCLISVSRGKTTGLSVKPPPLPRRAFTQQQLNDKYPNLYMLAIFKGLNFS